MKRQIPPANWQIARDLRKRPTVTEKALWRILRNRQLSVNFRRQHPLGPFIVDFVSLDLRLIIEADGDSHGQADAIAYDQRRQSYLESHGFQVVRYPDQEILHNLSAVVEDIRKHVAKQMPTPLSPPAFNESRGK